MILDRLRAVTDARKTLLGVGPMSGGRSSGIVAISPPDQYPQAVWDVLVAEGKLRKVSHGQYDLV